MSRIKGDRLYVKLGSSQVRRRLKGLGFGVRKVESAGRGEAIIIHTATGQHLRELQAIFQDVMERDKPERSVSAPEQLIATSKFLSLVLRHRPDVLGIELDTEGWVAVEELLAACVKHGRAISREQLDAAVRTNDKQRFAYSADGNRIRASQGHSLPIDLGLVPVEPPELLYHGTVPQFLDSIRREGLIKGKRHHVHLSADVPTATSVGQRRGRPIILVIEAGQMCRDGHKFYRSENGVWLTDAVQPWYIRE